MPDDPKYVYRGVHAHHPMIDAARRGEVIPGNENGSVTPERHNRGGWESFSPYTSWTSSYELAYDYATAAGAGFAVLRLDPSEVPPTGAAWSWVQSPDIFGESEVLLRGSRIGIEVIVHG